ncbi:MAG: VWA domain-containing protein [Spirochaetes bacterium]|nr:VWA domain-containing protein [Spirochaetota bacterium]
MNKTARQVYKLIALSAIKSFLFILFFIQASDGRLYAGPFIKIDRIDTEAEFPKISIFITVKDTDKINIKGLSEENIAVYEDGYIVNFFKVNNLAEDENILYTVLAVDSSKSISARLLKEIKNTADEFFTYSKSSDMTALYRFNDETILLNNFTNNSADLVKNINKIERHGRKTLLYDTLFDAVKLLNKVDSPRKALVVFTDGKDEGSSIELNDVIEFAKKSHVPVYSVTFNPQNRIKLLSRLTLLTDGKLYNSDKSNINKIYKSIVRDIKSQYHIEYKSMLEPDGKTHTIETRLKYDKLRDKDQRTLILKKPSLFFWFPLTQEAILIAIIILLIIILTIIVIFILIKLHKVTRTPSFIQKTSVTPNGLYNEKEKNSDELKNADNDKEESGQEKPEKSEEPIRTDAWLVERDGENAGKKIPIQYEESTIGRSKDNHIIIDDKSTSKKHAKIKIIKNSFYLFDMASDKGTYLNENKLLRPKLLYDWDEIRIGKKVFIFRISNVA